MVGANSRAAVLASIGVLSNTTIALGRGAFPNTKGGRIGKMFFGVDEFPWSNELGSPEGGGSPDEITGADDGVGAMMEPGGMGTMKDPGGVGMIGDSRIHGRAA